jgi:membrane fusion protein (multidrug efflux system)
MNARDVVTVLAALAAATSIGCSASGEGRSPREATGKPPVAVEVAAVAGGELGRAIDVVGSLKPKHEATIKSEYTGIVREVLVSEWVPVTRGQPLVRLDSREAEAGLEAARAALMQAEAAETRAVREEERSARLKAGGLATQQQLDDARSAREAAAAATAAARARLSAAETYAEKQLIRSPLDGVVAFRGVNVGDRVESMGSGEPMFRIVDNRVFDLTVAVPSVDMGLLRVGQTLTFTTDAYPGRTFRGTVAFINPAVDEASRSVKVVAEVPNPSGELRGGMFVEGEILAGTRAQIPLVPRAALLVWDVGTGRGEVFVVEGDKAVRRAVRTGAMAGDNAEVKEGLAVGDRVVVRGAFNLRDGDRVMVVSRGGTQDTTGS